MHSIRPLPIAAIFCLAACGSKGEATLIERPTLIGVDASLIAGELCSDAPGGIRRYVATVADTTPFMNETPPEDLCPSAAEGGATSGGFACPPFALPSSPPLPCTRPVGFGNVTPGHRYIGRLDGYDREELKPLAPGSRLMLGEDGEPVAPRWVWMCDQDVVAADNWTVPVQGCHPIIAPEGPPGETVLTIALGPICDSLADWLTVTSLTVMDDSVDASAASFGCDDVVPFRVIPDQTHTFTVSVSGVKETGETKQMTTSCYGVAREGQVVPASCDLLPTSDPDAPAAEP